MYSFEAGKLLPPGHITDIGERPMSARTLNVVARTLLTEYKTLVEGLASQFGLTDQLPEGIPTDGEITNVHTGETISVRRGRRPRIRYTNPAERGSATNNFKAVRRAIIMTRNLR